MRGAGDTILWMEPSTGQLCVKSLLAAYVAMLNCDLCVSMQLAGSQNVVDRIKYQPILCDRAPYCVRCCIGWFLHANMRPADNQTYPGFRTALVAPVFTVDGGLVAFTANLTPLRR